MTSPAVLFTATLMRICLLYAYGDGIDSDVDDSDSFVFALFKWPHFPILVFHRPGPLSDPYLI